MKVCLGIFWEIEVDDDVDGLNINPTCQKIGTYKIAADAITKVVENTVAVGLKHASMAVEARVAQFSDFLGKQLNAIGRVAEDDRLIDLKFGE